MTYENIMWIIGVINVGFFIYLAFIAFNYEDEIE